MSCYLFSGPDAQLSRLRRVSCSLECIIDFRVAEVEARTNPGCNRFKCVFRLIR